MSALERLVQAKNSAKNYYEAQKLEATARAQNVNKRNLQKCVKQVGEAWRAYYDAALNIVDKGVYAEEQDRVEARILAVDESIAHNDWFGGVEDVLTALEQADNPPVQHGLNAAQLLAGLNADIESKEEGVRDDLENIETSLNDGTIPLTKMVLQSLESTVDQAWTMADVTISDLYEQKTEEVPDQSDAITRSKNSFINEIRVRKDKLLHLIISKKPEEANPVQSGNPNPQAGAMTHIYKEYHRDAIPEFKGKLTEYAAFKKEWQTVCSTRSR